MKVQVYMQASEVKKIYKNTKKEFLHETNKNSTQKDYIHNIFSQTAEKIGYTSTEAEIMPITINEINNQDTVKRL